jgi:hypothetical protein
MNPEHMSLLKTIDQIRRNLQPDEIKDAGPPTVEQLRAQVEKQLGQRAGSDAFAEVEIDVAELGTTPFPDNRSASQLLQEFERQFPEYIDAAKKLAEAYGTEEERGQRKYIVRFRIGYVESLDHEEGFIPFGSVLIERANHRGERIPGGRIDKSDDDVQREMTPRNLAGFGRVPGADGQRIVYKTIYRNTLLA